LGRFTMMYYWKLSNTSMKSQIIPKCSFIHEPSDIFLVEMSYIYKPEEKLLYSFSTCHLFLCTT
jgi:hypothetical protein